MLLQTNTAIISVCMELYLCMKFMGFALLACLTAMVTSISIFKDQQIHFSVCTSYFLKEKKLPVCLLKEIISDLYLRSL